MATLHPKKALVTGACGFIGSHLTERLVKEGYQVKALVMYHPLNSWGWLDCLSKETLEEVEVFSGDIRSSDSVKKALSDCDVVFHLAALIGIPYSYQTPQSYVDTNITGTLNILQACQEKNIERVLVTSTSETYGSARYTPINEDHPLHAQSPYAATKIAADKLAESFHLSFNTPVTTVRPFNTYGPRQSARAIIPTIILQALSQQSHIKLGSLSPTRDLNYVEDVCRGFIEISKSKETIGKTINICSSVEIEIGELVHLILDLMNSDKEIISDDVRVRPKKSEVSRLLGCNKLITSLTSWRPQHSLKEGLKETIDWFSVRENRERFKPHIYNT